MPQPLGHARHRGGGGAQSTSYFGVRNALVDQPGNLEALSEELADVALELLGEAMGEADPKGSPAARAERVVTRARRSVEKASGLLAGIAESSGEAD